MTNYLLVYSADGHMPSNEAEKALVTKAWESWFASLGEQLVDAGNPFTEAANTIAPDGKIGEAVKMAGGYSIIKADSLDEALKLAQGCPVLKGGSSITVFETFNVM